jgi:hypothetical protein
MGGNQANQTDVYITKGGGDEQYTPFSTYHGFRYVSLEGLPPGYTPTNSTLTSHFGEPLHLTAFLCTSAVDCLSNARNLGNSALGHESDWQHQVQERVDGHPE